MDKAANENATDECEIEKIWNSTFDEQQHFVMMTITFTKNIMNYMNQQQLFDVIVRN